MTKILRQYAEQQYAEELHELSQSDRRSRLPGWCLSPRAVATFVLGGTLENGFAVSRKYIGDSRTIEVAIATLATDRALLILGVPGTAKTWVSELLAAAISQDSTLLVQGTAGTSEDAIRYGWNYALLLSEGPTRRALVPGPVMRAMEEGKVGRLEELTRLPSEVQDALITVLSEKHLPIPELRSEVQAIEGFNIVATANNRDRGVNELSSALRRRFNTVVFPLPATAEAEVDIVVQRLQTLRQIELPPQPSILDEIRRIVAIFRELRSGVSTEGKVRLKSPSGTMSTAEIISVVHSSLALATHFGDGILQVSDLAASLVGTVIKDPVHDRVVWLEYLETVVREREGWGNLYRACREATE